MHQNKIFIILTLLGLSVISRLIDHAPNFVPLAAVALAASLCLNKKWSIILPLGALFISDLMLGFYDWKLMAVVYGSFAVIGILSWWLKKHQGWLNILATSLAASVFFFFSTNTAVWLFSTWYPKTFSGLILSLEMGLPFFRNTLMADLFYTTILCGSIILIREIKHRKKIVVIS